METKDHFVYCAKMQGKGMTVSEKFAFILGNILPDLNIFTYLKRNKEGRIDLKGHNYENRLGYIEDVLEKVADGKYNGIRWYYICGIIMHYMTDAFTYSHNKYFAGNLRMHTVYEKRLHIYFRRLSGILKDFSYLL